MKGLRFLTAFLLCSLIAVPVTAANNEPIKIGAILGVTGPAANLGKPEANTLEMLTADINKKGGINGRKIQLIIKDSAASPEKAISFAKQLIDEDKVIAIIGPSTSGESMKIKGIADDGKTILLSCAAAEAIVVPVKKYIFKTPQNDRFAAMKIFYQMNKMGIKEIAVLSSNTGFGNAGKQQLETIAPQYGINIVANEVYDKEATDLSAVITKVKTAGAQAIVNWSIEPAQSIVIKNARQALGPDFPIFQSHGFGNINYVKAAGPAADGVIFPAGRLLIADILPNTNKQKPVLLKYKKSYEALYKEEASTFGGHAYDAFAILVEGIKKAGTDNEKLRIEIENMKGLVGTAGIFNFSPADHNGLNMDSFVMLTVKNGKFVPLPDTPVKKK
jgi:branched-chain amino acid transport system substrate-binding protein